MKMTETKQERISTLVKEVRETINFLVRKLEVPYDGCMPVGDDLIKQHILKAYSIVNKLKRKDPNNSKPYEKELDLLKGQYPEHARHFPNVELEREYLEHVNNLY